MLSLVEVLRSMCLRSCGCSRSRRSRFRKDKQPQVVHDELPVLVEQDGCDDYPAGSSELPFPCLDPPDHGSLPKAQVRAWTEVSTAHGREAQPMGITEAEHSALQERLVPSEDHDRDATRHTAR
jgi:hypothetical protein